MKEIGGLKSGRLKTAILSFPAANFAPLSFPAEAIVICIFYFTDRSNDNED